MRVTQHMYKPKKNWKFFSQLHMKWSGNKNEIFSQTNNDSQIWVGKASFTYKVDEYWLNWYNCYRNEAIWKLMSRKQEILLYVSFYLSPKFWWQQSHEQWSQ